MQGERLPLTVDGLRVSIQVRDTVAVSLRTKEIGKAKERFRDVSTQIHRLYQSFDEGAVALSHEQIMQLAGEWYRTLVSRYADRRRKQGESPARRIVARCDHLPPPA